MRLILLFFLLIFIRPISFAQSAAVKDSLIQLGLQYAERSEIVMEASLDSCIYYTDKARQCFKEAEAWNSYVDMISGMAGAYYYQANYESALKYNKLALQEARRHLGDSSKAFANALVTTGALLGKKGELEEAIKTFQHSLDLARQNGSSEKRIAIILHNISSFVERKGDYIKALEYLEQALKRNLNIYEKDALTLTRTYVKMGDCYRRLRQFDKAKELYFKAKEIFAQKPNGKYVVNRKIENYIDLAIVYKDLIQPDSMVYYADKALELQLAITPHLIEQSYSLLGDAAILNDKLDLALVNYQTGYENVLQRLSKYSQHPNIAVNLANIAKVYQLQNQYPQSLKYYQQSLIQLSRNFKDTTIANNPANEELMDKLEGIKILRAKATTLSLYHQQTQAPQLLHQAHATHLQLAELIALVRRSYREEESKYYLAEAAADIYEEAIETALLLHQQQADPRYLQAAFVFAERNKATLLQESIQARLASGLADTPDSLLAKERQYKTAISFYEREIAAQASQKDGGDAAKVKLWKEQLFEAKQAYEKVEQQLLKEDRRYRELKRQEQLVDLSSLQQQLGQQGRALIEYFYGKRQVYAFLLSSEAVKAYPLGPPETITAAVQQLRRLSSRPPDSRTFAAEYEQFQSLSIDLYQRLLAPLQSAIPEDITRLGIVPDDVLNYLPFDLLLVEAPEAGTASFSPQQNAYLFDQYTLSYAYSASLSVAETRLGKAAAGFLGFAPNFGDIASTERSCSANELSALLCNEEEIESISALFPGETFMEGQATKAQFEALSGHYQILHLATHACLDTEGGKLNKIFFADDYLSNFELANLDLKADLVVLSACNTGTGQLIRGEGVLSLARGFTIAGCPGTLMSLWAVDDCSTSQLMLRLYEQLKAGKAKDEALRQARLQFLTESDEEHRHPYYWAAFVQFGNIEALSGIRGTGPRWYIWVLAGVLILIALYRIFR